MASAHVTELKKGQKPPTALVVVARLVLTILGYLAVLTAVYALALLADASLLGLGLAHALALSAVLVVWRTVDRRPLGALGLDRAQAAPRWLRGAVTGGLMMGAIVLIWFTLITGATWSVNPDPVRAAAALAIGFVGFLIQGPAEEVLFRGYVLENVKARWGATWAVVISAVLFTLLHASNPGFGVLPAVNLTLFGIATALYKLRWDHGQLWGVFAMHTVWNWLQQVVFGLPNSGTTSTLDDVLFSVRPNTSQPDPLWGGGFGPEGTLGATLVLGVLIWATLRGPSQATSLRRPQ